MKAFGTLLLTFTIFGSSLAFADHKIQKTCLTVQNYLGSYYVSAEAVIDDETGLTKALLVSTMYEGAEECLNSLDEKFESPEMPSTPGISPRVRSACYTSVDEKKVVYLVTEKTNSDTGLVFSLEIKNEFDSAEACKGWL